MTGGGVSAAALERRAIAAIVNVVACLIRPFKSMVNLRRGWGWKCEAVYWLA